MLSKRFLAAGFISLCALAASVVSPVQANEVSDAVRKEIKVLQDTWATNPVLIEAIRKQNSKGISLNDIKKLDEKWRATREVADFMKPYLDNRAVAELSRLEKAAGYVVEAFAMDNQGAIVAATAKTSDFWQGDEAKFTESFKGGNGAVHIGDVEFDNSAQAYLVQVSIPVMDGGKAIGAITIGIDTDNLQ